MLTLNDVLGKKRISTETLVGREAFSYALSGLFFANFVQRADAAV